MFGPPTYSKKTRYPEYIYAEYKITAKYHQAAYTFFLTGIVYMVVFYLTMPPHDLGSTLGNFIKEIFPVIDDIVTGADSITYDSIVKILAFFLGSLFLGLSYFIYKECRAFVMILALSYVVSFAIAVSSLYIGGVFFAVTYVLPLIGITFYMLARASWNLRP